MCEVKKIGLSLQPDCLGGGIGRHAGLKIPWTAMSVRVRFPSEAHHIPLGSNSERDFSLYSIVWHRGRICRMRLFLARIHYGMCDVIRFFSSVYRILSSHLARAV